MTTSLDHQGATTTTTSSPSRDGTGSDIATLTPDAESAKGVVSQLLPPAEGGEDARANDEGCDVMPEDMDMSPDETFEVDRGPDGSFEREFGGSEAIVEVSMTPFTAAPSVESRDAADSFVKLVRQLVVAKGWDDPAVAARDGFRELSDCSDHWVNIDYMFDGKVLDVEHPEFLMYEPAADGRNHFVGTMFVAADADDHGPELFGAFAPWHYHDRAMCGVGALMLVELDPSSCPVGTSRFERSPEMLHVFQAGSDPFRSSMM